MVDFLWSRLDHAASFDDLLQPVYGDLEHTADASNFGSLRRAANGFFRKHKIPWCIRIAKTMVSLRPE